MPVRIIPWKVSSLEQGGFVSWIMSSAALGNVEQSWVMKGKTFSSQTPAKQIWTGLKSPCNWKNLGATTGSNLEVKPLWRAGSFPERSPDRGVSAPNVSLSCVKGCNGNRSTNKMENKARIRDNLGFKWSKSDVFHMFSSWELSHASCQPCW